MLPTFGIKVIVSAHLCGRRRTSPVGHQHRLHSLSVNQHLSAGHVKGCPPSLSHHQHDGVFVNQALFRDPVSTFLFAFPRELPLEASLQSAAGFLQ